MAAILYPAETETLEVDDYGISIGDLSVGLPVSRTADVVLERYLDLLRMRHGDQWQPTDESEHLAILSTVLRQDESVVRQRLAGLA